MAQPKTIKQYQTALARLGVQLPAGARKLSQYEALWQEANKNDENAERNGAEPQMSSPIKIVRPQPRRPTTNVPLSQQTPPTPASRTRLTRNLPTPQQPACVEPEEDTAFVAPSPPRVATTTRADSSISNRRTVKGVALLAALLSLIAALMLALPMLHPPVTNLEVETSVWTAGEDAVPSEMCEEAGDVVADSITESETQTAANHILLETEEAATGATTVADTSMPVSAEAEKSPASLADGVSADSAPTEPPPTVDEPVLSVGTALLGVTRELLQQAVHGAASLCVRASESVRSSESVHWMARSIADGWWNLLKLVLHGMINAVIMVARASFDLLSHLLPWLARTAPVATRTFLASCFERPQLAAACLAAIGAVHCFGRAGFWYGRWRDGRHAGRAAQVDAAARWVMCELREHAQRWESVSGHAMPIPPDDLRSRVPHTILSDRHLWKEVAARVRSDDCVEVTGASAVTSPRGSSSEGWRFVGGDAVGSPWANRRASHGMYSPYSPRGDTAAYVRP